MEKFVVGQVVIASFPFSNLKSTKKRPALVLALAEFGDLILCQITSKPYSSKIAVKISKRDFVTGKLPINSYVRPDKVFTAEKTVIIKSAGVLNTKTKNKVLQKVRALFK